MRVLICVRVSGPPQVRHRPTGREDHGGVLVGVVHQEHPAAQVGQGLLHGLPVEARSRPGGGHPFQPGRHPLFIVVGLQAADEPRAGVGQASVVQVQGVLDCEQDAHSERPCLFEQGQQRSFRGRLGHRWEEAEDLVHVDQRPQRSGARLRPYPAQHLVQEQRHEEHALGVAQMGDGHDRHPRLPFGRMQQTGDVERLAFHPGSKARSRQQVVHAQASSKRSLEG